ncbi:site-specific integrase [Mycolicibacterium neoaurum]|uniref:site-specific integrase n=1 Tax=Mycolicibacterium neoaurum TaxID=1795 RepID=UPI00248C1CAC|nr:site-specific integrase [Mycolicibacterium neoaurum]WBP92789.1 site-specific integrase [Mycolicibacterium neoaurum]WBS06351.1 site-specific integrase [Mycolicibacterium neoaurum]
MSRQQLPPQIRKREVKDRRTGKPVVRYELFTDVGDDPTTGKRRQVRRRFKTEREARDALAEVLGEAAKGTFVARKKLTVADAIEDFIAARHNLRATSLSKLTYDLAVLKQFHGDMPLQQLTKADIDRMVTSLVKGGTTTPPTPKFPKGRTRKPWGSKAVNKVIVATARLLEDAHRQGLVPRNVAAHVNRVSSGYDEPQSFTETEVRQLLGALQDDRLAHAWHLALSGLRRGEIAGLRWSDVDFDTGLLTIANNRVSAGGRSVENDPKSFTSRRTLPLPERLVVALRDARERQRVERVEAGAAYRSGAYVVSNEIGDPYSPAVLSRYWGQTLARCGMRHIKLHAARHTCATLMHLQGVPVAVIAAWIGHKDAALTMRLYAHSQDEALKVAATAVDYL